MHLTTRCHLSCTSPSKYGLQSVLTEGLIPFDKFGCECALPLRFLTSRRTYLDVEGLKVILWCATGSGQDP